MKQIILKPVKDKAIRNHHHWIFSGAVQEAPAFNDGDILSVFASNGDLLGEAYFNKKSGIIGRMVSFGLKSSLDALSENIDSAIAMRKRFFDHSHTTGYRLINAEGDGIPGLVVDRYSDVLVMQIGTMGANKLKPWFVQQLVERLKPRTIYEKSVLPARKEEGLREDVQGILYGEEVDTVTFKENGLIYETSLRKSQKTGFFLDHREMRLWVQQLAKGLKVLNAFSYSGGFSISALAGGAKEVDFVDISAEALKWAKKNVELNGFTVKPESYICADVFEFLRERELSQYGLVILDPPAFAKRKKDVVAACRGYKDINRLAIQKMPPNSILLTCSCSHHVDETLFRQVIFQAAAEAKRRVRIVGSHRLAMDHPINIFHPESDYLKSLVLYID